MRRFVCAAVVAGLWLAALPSAVAAPGPGDDGTHRREGEYGGVNPAGPPVTDAKHKAPGPKTLGWIGFAARDGGAELFFQASQPFEVVQRVEGDAVVVTLVGLSKLARNTRRPLDTRFFEAPIARVSAKVVRAVRARRGQAARPAGVEVRIAFKQGAPATEAAVRTATEADRLVYAYLSFGPAPAGTITPSEPGPSMSDPE